MVGVVVAAEREYYLTLDGSFARVAAWREELVEIEVTEEMEVIIAVDNVEKLWVVGGEVRKIRL